VGVVPSSQSPSYPYRMRLPPVSVLCLHGYSQSSSVLQSHMRRVTERLSHRARFEFVDGPFTVPQMMDPSKTGCSWWIPKRDGAGDWEYEGVDAALETLAAANRAETARHGHGFAGLLGFSQGGALASLVLALREHTEQSPLPELRFAVFAGAFAYRAAKPSYAHLLDCSDGQSSLHLPTLHFVGERDTIITSARSAQLEALCSEDARVLCRHSGGHVVPAGTAALEAFDSFLVSQQRTALSTLAAQWSNGSYC
jgi:predicted esterase